MLKPYFKNLIRFTERIFKYKILGVFFENMIVNPHPGKFISFEGIDGSGKSEQFTRVKNFINAYKKGVKWAETKEPTDRPFGQEIYQVLNGNHPQFKLESMHPYHFQSMYFRDRVWDYKNRIIPALSSGIHMFSDRGPASVVFGARHDGDFGPLMGIQEQMFLGAEVPFIWPDLILIYDVDVELAIHRLKKKGRVMDKFEQEENLQRVRENYLVFSRIYPNCIVVNGSLTEDQVFKEAKPYIMNCLGINGDNGV